MESSGSGRGGARPGAGRPSKGRGERRKGYKPVLVTPEAYAALDGVKNKCGYVSALILEDREKRKGS